MQQTHHLCHAYDISQMSWKMSVIMVTCWYYSTTVLAIKLKYCEKIFWFTFIVNLCRFFCDFYCVFGYFHTLLTTIYIRTVVSPKLSLILYLINTDMSKCQMWLHLHVMERTLFFTCFGYFDTFLTTIHVRIVVSSPNFHRYQYIHFDILICQMWLQAMAGLIGFFGHFNYFFRIFSTCHLNICNFMSCVKHKSKPL